MSQPTDSAAFGQTAGAETAFAQTEVRNLRLYWLALAAVTLALIAPIWAFDTLPWEDYGDHLARVYIYAHYQDVPLFQQQFEILAEPLPNLAMDLIATPLLWFLPVSFVAHLFPTILILVFVAGCHSFAKAEHGTPSWLAVPAVFLVYNILLMWGFVNYVFSTGLFLIAAASWLRFQQQPTLRRATWATLLALTTYLAHLSGFFFLCVLNGIYVAAAGFEALQHRRPLAGFPRKALGLLLPLSPGLALYAYLLFSSQLGEDMVKYTPFSSKLTRIWTVFGSDLAWVDIAVAGALVAAIGLTLLDGRCKIRTPLSLVILCFWVMYAAFPDRYHTSAQVDTRFLLPATVLLPLSLSIRLPRLGGRLAYGLIMAAMFLRLGGIVYGWQLAEPDTVEQRHLLSKVEPESLVFGLTFIPEQEASKMALIHVPGYVTIDRNAVASSTFGIPGQQPLRWRDPPPELENYVQESWDPADWNRALERFDYIWLYEAPPDIIASVEPRAELVAQAGLGRLYRLKHSK